MVVPREIMCSQARQSVVVIDGMWIVVATQCKFMLAFLASMFGSCYPQMYVAMFWPLHR